jgi:hypothetical protein
VCVCGNRIELASVKIFAGHCLKRSDTADA